MEIFLIMVTFFENITSLQRSLILIGGLTLFLLLENAVPLFRFKYHKWKHFRRNMFFTLTTIIVNFLCATLLVICSDWTQSASFGILPWLDLPLILSGILGLMILDLIAAYLSHWTEHKIWFLWQFHTIHHSDKEVDTTTANRHHPGESVIRVIFTILAILIVGAPMWLVFLYQSLSAFLSQFNHSNISIPKGIERLISLVIVTPDMHHVHHHYKQPYSDKNFGNIFSVWDRAFGTFIAVDNSNLTYGLDTYPNDKEAEDIGLMLRLPFMGYRKPTSDN